MSHSSAGWPGYALNSRRGRHNLSLDGEAGGFFSSFVGHVWKSESKLTLARQHPPDLDHDVLFDLDVLGIMMFSCSSLSAVGPNRTKLVTPNSSLKFTPEELVLYCRDMRVICFLFDRLTPDTQVLEVRTHVLIFSVVIVKPIGADEGTDAQNFSSDDLHHRKDLPAAQTRVCAVFPECRFGKCRWATLYHFLEGDMEACLKPWKLSSWEEFGLLKFIEPIGSSEM